MTVPIEVAGRVERGTFVLSAFGRDMPLRTVETGKDDGGSFALLSVGEWDFGELRLRIEEDPDEPFGDLPALPPGGLISLTWGTDDRARGEFELARRGIDPREVVFAALGGEGEVGIYFDFDGHPSGVTRGGKVPPPAAQAEKPSPPD